MTVEGGIEKFEDKEKPIGVVFVEDEINEPGKTFSGAEVNKMLDNKIDRIEKKYDDRFKQQAAEAEKNQTVACLQTYIDGTPGETIHDEKFKRGVQDLILSVIRADSDKDNKWFLAEAAKLAEHKFTVIKEAGGDGAQDPIKLRQQSQDDHGMFSFPRFLGGLMEDIEAQGKNFSYGTLGEGKKNEELEWLTQMPPAFENLRR